MDTNLLWTLKQLQLALDQSDRVRMETMDLSSNQGIVLYYLLTHAGQATYAVDLHAGLGMSKSSLSAILKALRQKGYLRVQDNPADDRKKRIVLTDKAYSARKDIEASLQKQQKRLYRSIPEQHLEWMQTDLNIMLANAKKQPEQEDTI